ncbi:hypothetical protein NHQ30_002864 [Ciborinia camelliae]|nr:hypothetical protein NHQ30_002864 [Ciborinia camelliae]
MAPRLVDARRGMKGFLSASLLVVVGAAGLAQGFPRQARGLNDIIAALQGAKGGKGGAAEAAAVTKEIIKTMTVTKYVQGAAAPTEAVQAAGTGGQLSFLTQTLYASGAPPTVTVTPLPQMITQTVTETEQVMVTMNTTQTTTVMVSDTVPEATIVASSQSEAAIPEATNVAPSQSEAAIPEATTIVSSQSETAISESTSQASVATMAAPQAGVSAAPVLGAAQVAQPNSADTNTLSLSSSLILGNLAVATAV